VGEKYKSSKTKLRYQQNDDCVNTTSFVHYKLGQRLHFITCSVLHLLQ